MLQRLSKPVDHTSAPSVDLTSQRSIKDSGYAVLFLGPTIVLLLIFVFFPMLKTLYMSFFLTNDYGQATAFVGLSNYLSLLTSPAYLSSLGATLVFVAAVSVLTVVLGVVLAVAANQQLKGIRLFRTLFSGTMGVSISVAAIFWLFAFNPSVGVFAQLSQALHLPVVNWLTDPKSAMVAIILSTVWMNLGFTFLIIFGALQSVPQSLYEAADIAGTSKMTQLFKVTIPMISSTLFFVTIVTLIEAFKSFGLIDMMTEGGPDNATNLLVYRIYADSFLNGNFAQGSTESILLTVIIAIFTLIQFKFIGKRVHY